MARKKRVLAQGAALENGVGAEAGADLIRRAFGAAALAGLRVQQVARRLGGGLGHEVRQADAKNRR